MSKETALAAERLMELAAMPIEKQKPYVREWPELGWDGIMVARAYLAIESGLGGCVVQADDGTTMFTVKLPSAPDGPRPYVNTLAEFRAALAKAMAVKK